MRSKKKIESNFEDGSVYHITHRSPLSVAIIQKLKQLRGGKILLGKPNNDYGDGGGGDGDQ